MPRLHPYSAGIDAVQRGVQVGSTGLFVGFVLGGVLDVGGIWVVAVLAPLGFLVGAGYAVARYLRFEYELTTEELVVSSGVFGRQQREIPLRRIQNVDISRNLLQRALGLAVVRFETAGGSATEAVLSAVAEPEARRLQREMSGHRTDTAGAPDSSEGDAAEAVPERNVVYSLSDADLLTLSAISFRPGALGVPFLGAPFADDVLVTVLRWVLRAAGVSGPITLRRLLESDPMRLLLAGLFLLVLYLFLVWVASGVLTFIRFYGFELERQGDELRYERGLLSRYSGTVPLGKVQTVTIGENVAMRSLGYAALAVETAGYAPGTGRRSAGGAETTVPLAAREEVVSLARSVQAFPDPEFDTPPARARRRYARRYAVLLVGITLALVALDRLVGAVPLPVLFAPLAGLAAVVPAARLKWRHRGVDPRDDVLLTRSGFWRRRTRVVPYDRLQTVFVTRTVLQRRWSLASVTADTASTASLLGGDATAFDLDDTDASQLRAELLDRFQSKLAARRVADAPVGAAGRTNGDGAEFEYPEPEDPES